MSRNPQSGIIKWLIKTTCDGCLNEVEPLCIKYCVYGAIIYVKRKNIEEIKTHE